MSASIAKKENLARFHALSAEEQQMASGKIPGLFVKFALPGICGLLFISLQMLVDGLLIGRFIGAGAMASVNITLPIFALFWALCVAVAVGNEFQVSYALGRENRQDAADAFSTSVSLMLVMSLVWSAVCLFLGPAILEAMGANHALRADSLNYLVTLSWFMPFAALMLLADFTLKSLGHPLRAVIIMAGMAALNVLLDILFIAVFSWGVAGAALATGISYVLGFCLNFLPFVRRGEKLWVFGGKIRPRLVLRMLYNGSSEGLGEGIGASTTLLMNLTMLRFAGAEGVAALTGLSYLTYIATTIFMGTSEGIRPVVSFNYGRRNIGRMIAILRLAAVCILTLGILLFALLFFNGEMLTGLFFRAEDQAVADFAAAGAKIFAFTFLACGLNIMASGYFTSIGNARVSAVIALLNGLVFVVAGLLIYPRLWGVTGIWLVVPLSQLFTLCLSLPLMLRSLRQLKG